MKISESRISNRVLQIDVLHHVFQFLLFFSLLFSQFRNFLAENGQAVFLRVKLFGVALQQGLFLGAAFERFHVLADAALVGVNGVEFLLPGFGIRLQFADLVFLIQHLRNAACNSGVMAFSTERTST